MWEKKKDVFVFFCLFVIGSEQEGRAQDLPRFIWWFYIHGLEVFLRQILPAIGTLLLR